MAIWGAVITGVVSAGAAYVSSKNAQKNAKAVNKYNQSEYQARLDYEREKLARKQNSMGAGIAPFLADQMLHVYGEQSKGVGGFNLDIEAIRKAMHLDERQAGNFYDQAGGSGVQGSGGVAGGGGGQGRMDSRTSKYYSPYGVDPEAEGYDGKAYSKSSGGMVDGDPFSGMGHTDFGGFGSPIGSREETHGTGGVTTQTERGYDDKTQMQGPGYAVSQKTPIQRGTLATGGDRDVATFGRDVELPDHLIQKFGLTGLKAGASTFVPGIGLVANIAGKIVQRFGKGNGKQSWWETALGINDKKYGKFFGAENPQVAYQDIPLLPVGRG